MCSRIVQLVSDRAEWGLPSSIDLQNFLTANHSWGQLVMPTFCFGFTSFGCISGWKDTGWRDWNPVRKFRRAPLESDRDFTSWVSWRQMNCVFHWETQRVRDWRLLFSPSSDLCHFLCLLEECLIIRTNHSGRHPEPHSCSEVYLSHCSGFLHVAQSSRRHSTQGSRE